MELQNRTDSAKAVVQPSRIPLREFVAGIETLSQGVVTKDALYQYLTTWEVDPAELARYKRWMPERHTRNLIFRNPIIEVMILCWNVGNKTPLHSHNGQLGWMVMLEGKLRVENYRVVSCNRPENQNVVGLDCLAGATQIDMKALDVEIAKPGGPLNTVDKKQTIHRISNDAEWNEPAVSMHVYSLPIESCVVYDLENQRCYRRDLKYDY